MKEEEKKEEKTEVSWSAAEHAYVEKDVRWYLTIGGIALLLIILALWQGNYFFAAFIAVAGAILSYFGKRRPRVFDFTFTEEGVSVGGKFIGFDRLESFSLRERPNALGELILKQNAYVNPYVRIPGDTETLTRARALLSKRIPEVEYEESLLDLVAEWLGF